jgi:hypothetical protein
MRFVNVVAATGLLSVATAQANNQVGVIELLLT